MEFSGFTNEDFDVFTIEGFEARMAELKTRIRPKLEALGMHFTPTLSSITGDEMFPHVAKHARRTINPPKDTWVAFSKNPRGYKMLPHFQIGLWETHLFIWFAVIYEAPQKAEIASKFEKKITMIQKQIPSHFMWSDDHMKPGATLHSKLGRKGVQELFQRVQTVKKAELLCGRHFSKEEVVQMSSSDLLKEIENTFITLLPLYKLT
ncbi:YktB family protein [Bacillus sp. CGMCC 1.16607]|uniref:YktB family protein n=1 Tax=Bacillus sp. CGMCC 1.16607 TaxID=3351842 RepID=UPI003645F08E